MDLAKAVSDSFNDLFKHNTLFNLHFGITNPFSFPQLNSSHKTIIPSHSLNLISTLVEILMCLVFISLIYSILKLIPKFLSVIYNLKQPFVILEIKPLQDTRLSAYSTQQLFTLLHGLVGFKTRADKLLRRKKTYSLEIVSSKDEGIRYLVRVYESDADLIRKRLIAYLPGTKVEQVADYLPGSFQDFQGLYKTVELKLAKHFAYPLNKQTELEEHDPIAYITGNMTKLEAKELVALQLIISPIDKYSHRSIVRTRDKVNSWINQGYDLSWYLKHSSSLSLFVIPKLIIRLTFLIIMTVLEFALDMIKTFAFNEVPAHSGTASLMLLSKPKYKMPNNPYHQELETMVKGKIDSSLFETTLRLVAVSDNKRGVDERLRGLVSSFTQFNNLPHQILVPGFRFSNFRFAGSKQISKLRFKLLKNRLDILSQTSTLSIPEIADIYHFPFTSTTKTEDLLKIRSKELPAPLSLKRANNLDVTFAVNHYGGTTTPIGLTEDERRRHMYILGATGTGKSTLLLSMINQDLQNGKGVCVIDPHGELAESVLNIIPANREEDVIYFNPVDIDHPIGLNLLELSDEVRGNELLIEKEFVTESIISLFHKLYPDKYSGPRMEYILRNTIHTTFTLKTRTLFTVFKILTNPKFMRGVTKDLTDENLKDFWKYEFQKAGDYQKVKMISPITNKIGRFLFSPTAKSILEQEHSTIDFDEIMDQGKILICNLSKGKLGEDTSEMFGGLVMAKIQLAALRRARVDSSNRRDFYLYVDEFQNFASPSFAQILSEARKYKLNAILAHQTISQLEDKDLVNVTLANTGTVICFRTANPKDEDMILPQFQPVVQKGEIANLPSFHFYIKLSALDPQDAFSGETVLITIPQDKRKVDRIIKLSRAKYGLKKEIKVDLDQSNTTPKTTKPKHKIIK